MIKTPTVIGSQGLAGLFPENTLSGVNAALEVGVDGVELDFHLTKDGHLVAHHDYLLNPDLVRDAQGNWVEAPGPALKSLTLAQLKTYDVGRVRPGSPIEESYPDRAAVDGEELPTLEQVADAVKKNTNSATEIWIEIKSSPFGSSATTSTPQDYIKTLSRVFIDRSLRQRCCVINFDWRLLQQVQQQWPGMPTGYLTIDPKWLQNYSEPATDSSPQPLDHSPMHSGFTQEKYGSFPRAVKAAGGTYWSPFIGDLTPELVHEAHSLGIKVSTWSADGSKLMAKALALGVDSITNSRPDLLMALRES